MNIIYIYIFVGDYNLFSGVLCQFFDMSLLIEEGNGNVERLTYQTLEMPLSGNTIMENSPLRHSNSRGRRLMGRCAADPFQAVHIGASLSLVSV